MIAGASSAAFLGTAFKKGIIKADFYRFFKLIQTKQWQSARFGLLNALPTTWLLHTCSACAPRSLLPSHVSLCRSTRIIFPQGWATRSARRPPATRIIHGLRITSPKILNDLVNFSWKYWIANVCQLVMVGMDGLFCIFACFWLLLWYVLLRDWKNSNKKCIKKWSNMIKHFF